MNRTILTGAIMATICFASVSYAQRPRGNEQTTAEKKLSPKEALERRFQEFPLRVGEAFPEVDIYDDSGKPLNTRSLKGQYTVVVNGCLT